MTGRDEQDLPLAQPLTPREQEVLDCIGEGMSNQQVAEHLTIAVSTVKWYMRQIHNKLGVDNRADAVSRARSLGLLEEEQEHTIRHNLLVAATPFVGRERELALLAELIADPQARIITIVGPGGIGKTRLALEAARREINSRHLFSHGVFFIDLTPLASAAGIPTKLAATLNFHFHISESNTRTESQQILDYLKQKHMLLIMDNFEHILDGRTFLMEMSAHTAGIKILVTSRERLQLREEHLFPLHGLETPEAKDYEEWVISDYPAAQLFLNISGRTLPDFQLLTGDAGQLARICRLVEGMPLGLELAASWVGLLSLSDIASEIEKSLSLLASENHDVPVRHRSMQATLVASWRNLKPDQQLGFKKLTVFRGGFTRSAALDVAHAALPLLVTLVNKSWLFYDRGKDRFIIHELLRQFGAEKLRADPDKEQAFQERHSAYFCGFLNERKEVWFGPRQSDVASELRGEIENIQAAWQRAAKEGDITLLTEGLSCLCHFYKWEGRDSDGRNACRIAADGLSRRLAKQDADDPERLALWSVILTWESEFVNDGVQSVKLLSLSQKLLDRATQTGRDTRSERAYWFLRKARTVGKKDFEEAIQNAADARGLFLELGDRWGECEALTHMGNRYIFQGDSDSARESLQKCLEIRRQLEDTFGISDTLMNLGLTYQHQGNYEKAEALHLQAIEIYRQLENRFYESRTLTVISFAQSWSGKFTAARESAEQSLEIRRDLGGAPYLWNLIALTNAYLHLGSYDETNARAANILELAQQRGHSTEKGYALMYLGNIAFIEGNSAKAMVHLEESARLMSELRYVYQGLPKSNLCYVVRARGDSKSAHVHLVSALRSGIDYHSTTPIMYCLPVAALLAADDERLERAIELYSLAQRFGHITNSRWFKEVACQELDEVRSSLLPQVATAAEASGRELDIWHTANDLLEEYSAKT